MLLGLCDKLSLGGRFYGRDANTFVYGYIVYFCCGLLIQAFKSSKDILYFSSTSRHFDINSLRFYDIFSDSLNLIGILVILSINYF